MGWMTGGGGGVGCGTGTGLNYDRGRNPDRRAGWRNWRTQLLEDIDRHVGIHRPRWNDDRDVLLQRADGDMRPAEWRRS